MTRQSKGRKRKYEVEPKYGERLHDGITNYLDSLDLQLSDNVKIPTGTSIIQENTKKDYNKHFRGFASFCATIGDYESIVVAHEHSPDAFCPSMKAENVALYFRYKRWEQGSVLKSFTTNEVVTDIYGEAVLCAGGWNDPGNANQFLSAITSVHKARQQMGPYKAPCATCIEQWRKNPDTNGCRFHPGDIRVWRTGNPRNSEIVHNSYRENTKELFDYEVRGSYQLLPVELLEIRKIHDEFSNIKVEDIQRDLSILKEGAVEALAIRVCGKTDKIWRTLVLWRKDDVPEFCPIRHLLTYIHLAKIKTRYLFPNLRKKEEKEENNGLLKLLKDRFGSILDRDQNITTHTFRKTGYLFASWGGADMDTTMKSARHLNQATAAIYMQDAKFQLDWAEVHDPNARFQVPRFRMSIILNEASGRRTNELSLQHFRCLYSLSQTFLDQIGIFNLHRRRQTPHFIIHEALNYKTPTNMTEDLNKLLQESVPPSIAEEIRRMFAQIIQHERRKTTQAQEETTAIESLIAMEHQNSSSQHVITTKRGGDNNLMLRYEVKKRHGIEKLHLLLQIQHEVPEDLEELTSGARAFYFSSLTPVLSCLRYHFNNDCDSFIAK